MYNPLLMILLILSSPLSLQSLCSQQNHNLATFDASAGDLFERPKERGFEGVMQNLTGLRLFWLAVAFSVDNLI